jgi:hypothetical protein
MDTRGNGSSPLQRREELTENIVLEGSDDAEMEQEAISDIPSFAMNDEEANDRENAIDPTSLGIDEELDESLSELKETTYNAIIYGPPVGSAEAQDLQNLEHYEELLVQLCNLATQVLRTGQPQQMPSTFVQQFPTESQPLVVAYYERICNFQKTNTDPQLRDVLEDFLQRRLKEQPSPY